MRYGLTGMGIRTVPDDPHGFLADVETVYGLFSGCAQFEEVPEGFFARMPRVTDFSNLFRGCTALRSVPAKLFAANEAAVSFYGTFAESGLESVDAALFAANGEVETFYETFCKTKLTSVPAELFSRSPKAVNFGAEGRRLVNSVAELMAADADAAARGAEYLQESDLDLLGDAAFAGQPVAQRLNWTPIGSDDSFSPKMQYITPDAQAVFQGRYDGGGHSIANLWVSRDNNAGLFGCVGPQGRVECIVIASASIEGKLNLGAVCGVNFGRMESCSNSAAVTTGFGAGMSYTGGVCGESYGTIEGCYFLRHDDAELGVEKIGAVKGETAPTAVYAFGAAAWPSASDTDWGVGDAAADGVHWQSLGGWRADGSPVGAASDFPILWWQR